MTALKPGIETSPDRAAGEVSKNRFAGKSPRKRLVGGDGTKIAINYPTSGNPVKTVRRNGRGGARNFAHRTSSALTGKQALNLIAATEFAWFLDLPFTRMITIHWQAAGVAPDQAVKATGRFLDLLTKSLARYDYRTAYIWVHEGGEDKGVHCHLLVHVDSEVAPLITRLQKSWLRRITGRPYKKRVIRSSPIGGRLGLEQGNRPLLKENVQVALEYVLKGVAPSEGEKLNLTRLEPGGVVTGKRCGTSQNLGPTARKKAPRPSPAATMSLLLRPSNLLLRPSKKGLSAG